MKQIPRLHFAHLPTPIEELPRLTEHLKGPRIIVKRDDQTGLAFGCNKTRKLEFLVAKSQEQGAKIITIAAKQDHQRKTWNRFGALQRGNKKTRGSPQVFRRTRRFED